MTIEELNLIPDATPNQDVAEDGLMPCWLTFSCMFVASIFTTNW